MSEEVAVVQRSRNAIRQSWVERMARFAAAGLSVVAFCSAEGVSTQSFYYWRQKLACDAPSTSPAAPRLLPVHLLAPTCSVEIVLPGGTLLRVSPGCDLSFVRSLVTALEASPC